MKYSIFILSVLLFVGIGAYSKPIFQKFGKSEFYAVMKSGDLQAIDTEMEALNGAPEKDKEGYEGALLMKKAGLMKKAKEKLKYFKEGRIKLETAIAANGDNIEFHFLRLAIEEHAPKIVKYHSDIPKDKELVVKHFNEQSPAVQHAILDYCNNSKVLHKEDFSPR